MSVMFGLVRPCRHQLDDELMAQWRAHLCGMCISLRDGHGQLSRMTTNTDAVMISILVEAQSQAVPQRSGVGPCPLRGMASATIVKPDSLSVRLGATSSLTLAAAKAADVVAEQRFQLTSATPVRSRAAGALAGSLTRRALADGEIADVIEVNDLLTELAGQAELESSIQTGDSLDAVTRGSASAAARIFAGSAEVAGAPENADELREMGRAYGRLAHLLDAVEDLDKDRADGSFNPIAATGTDLSVVRNEAFHLSHRIRQGFDRLKLVDGRLLRVLLVDVLHSKVHQVFDPGRSHNHEISAADSTAVMTVDDSLPNHDYSRPRRRSFPRRILPWIGVYCTGYALCADHENPCTGKRHSAGCKNCDCDCCDCCDCCN